VAVATILSISAQSSHTPKPTPSNAHAHIGTPASMQLTPKKRLQKSIKIQFPALLVNFAAAALQFTAQLLFGIRNGQTHT